MIDETYLGTVCRHLTDEDLSAGFWQAHARRWARRTARPGSGRFLDAPVIELYIAAEAAGLPPSDGIADDDVVVHENILAAVLAAHAVLATAGRGHRPGAPGIGKAIGAIAPGVLRGESLELTTRQMAWSNRTAITRMLAHLQHVEEDVDLRTVAALACGVQGHRTMLRTNPTGHGPEMGLWSPTSEFNRTACLARWRVERETT
ncbi:hypothetical protein GCM10010433_49320 [Streptomyces pulveraceus]|uniref:Uncharacterized protein n=1 Tax=Streptomyces pulveraceus TaxID=68258 RepID=A0ABW1GKU5_9ACTN